MSISPRDERGQGEPPLTKSFGFSMEDPSEDSRPAKDGGQEDTIYGKDKRSERKTAKKKPSKKKSFMRRYAGRTSLAALGGLATGVALSLLLLAGVMDPVSHLLKQTIHLLKQR